MKSKGKKLNNCTYYKHIGEIIHIFQKHTVFKLVVIQIVLCSGFWKVNKLCVVKTEIVYLEINEKCF